MHWGDRPLPIIIFRDRLDHGGKPGPRHFGWRYNRHRLHWHQPGHRGLMWGSKLTSVGQAMGYQPSISSADVMDMGCPSSGFNRLGSRWPVVIPIAILINIVLLAVR